MTGYEAMSLNAFRDKLQNETRFEDKQSGYDATFIAKFKEQLQEGFARHGVQIKFVTDIVEGDAKSLHVPFNSDIKHVMDMIGYAKDKVVEIVVLQEQVAYTYYLHNLTVHFSI